MTTSRSIQKWGPIVLGVVCLFMIVKLVRELNGSPQPAARVDSPSAHRGRRSVKIHALENNLTASGELRLDVLKAANQRPLPTFSRNPFGYPPPPPPPGMSPGERLSGDASSPPPPPPIPLKALGYSQDQEGNRQAYLSGQDEVYAARVGDEISHRYKVLAITPMAVIVEDTQSGEKARLPIPQAQ